MFESGDPPSSTTDKDLDAFARTSRAAVSPESASRLATSPHPDEAIPTTGASKRLAAHGPQESRLAAEHLTICGDEPEALSARRGRDADDWCVQQEGQGRKLTSAEANEETHPLLWTSPYPDESRAIAGSDCWRVERCSEWRSPSHRVAGRGSPTVGGKAAE